MFDEQKRQAELDKRDAQLREWSAEIDKRMARIQAAKADVQRETLLQLETQLNQLITSRDAAKAELEKLRGAGESTWTNLLQTTDSMFQSAAQKFHAFVSTHT
ncbi:MAG: hypothetical protein AB1Z22_11620 [Synechococcaceae cyanobacterium]